MSSEDWRIGTDAKTYFLHEQKANRIERRRPTVRTAGDLVGPGIDASATTVTNWNDVLATFDGYFSSAAGAASAPTPGEPYVGHTVSDADLGGYQTLTGVTSGSIWVRTFNRNAADPETVGFTPWTPMAGVGALVKCQATSLYVTANVWTPVPLTTYTDTRGNGAVLEATGTGLIRVKREGWYTLSAGAFWTDYVVRGVLRVITGTDYSVDPDQNILLFAEGGNSQGVPALMPSDTVYLQADTLLRMYLYSSSAATVQRLSMTAKEG